MDKYEYKIRSQEIKDLIAKKEYAAAMKIADTVDWRRVKSVVMLCTISDLYKVNRRYEESKELLLLAYEKHSGGRMIVYSLCELCIKLDEVVQAVEYYKEFVQIAPKDNGRYILQYKIYEAQDVSLEERIAVLEELKHREYREKWAYELAYLYHRVGLSTRCVEECDELILWFGEGKYVTKAMELKMLHAPLTTEQQLKYKGNKLPKTEAVIAREKAEDDNDMDIQVKTVNVGQYDTMNLQKALAESMKEVLDEAPPAKAVHEPETVTPPEAEVEETTAEPSEEAVPAIPEEPSVEDDQEMSIGSVTREIIAPFLQDTGEIMEIKLPEEPEETPPVEELEPIAGKTSKELAEETEVADIQMAPETKEELPPVESPEGEEVFFEDKDTVEMPVSQLEEIQIPVRETPKPVLPKKEFENFLAQEYDGQISLVVPEAGAVEKQITGQLSIEDILAEWERMKKENEQKRAEDVRKRVMQQTGSMFSEFDASTKQGVLEQLEDLAGDSIRKEAERARKGAAKIVKISDITSAKKAETSSPTISAADIMAGRDTAAEELPEVEGLEEMEGEAPAAMEETSAQAVTEDAAVEKQEATGEEKDAEKVISSEKEPNLRAMTKEEKTLFGSFIQTKTTKKQILEALDKMSLAAYTGNVIVTAEPGSGSIRLAQNLIKSVQLSDHNFSGRVAKIKGRALNDKDIENTFTRLKNGALIVEKAGELKPETVKKLVKAMEQEKMGIIVIMEDTKIAINKLLEVNHTITGNFNIRIDVEALNNDTLVQFGKRYAQEMEYSIDELGVLALYTRISDMQTSEHIVTTAEVKEIVDEAIHHANRKNLTHFMDILFARRYDEEDMIILRERDFAG